MRNQGDLGSKARKERARKARAQAERCVRPFMAALSELDVLHLTLHCFGRRVAEKDSRVRLVLPRDTPQEFVDKF